MSRVLGCLLADCGCDDLADTRVLVADHAVQPADAVDGPAISVSVNLVHTQLSQPTR